MIVSHSFLLILINVSDKNEKKYCRAGQATDDNIVRALCMLDNEGYRHTLGIKM